MDFSYINLLYKDLNTKKAAIKQYCESVGEQAGDIYASVYEAISLVKEKYEAITASKGGTTKRMPPTSEFAVEDISSQKKAPEAPDASASDLRGIDDNLAMNFSEISFRFQKEQKILQNLVAACGEYQDIVNQIFSAWEQILDKNSN